MTKLTYKVAEKGVHLVKLYQWFASSKSCHLLCLQDAMPEMLLHKRIWRCPDCGTEPYRNINAVFNIPQKEITEQQSAGLVISPMVASLNPSYRRLQTEKWEAPPD